jgi:hypothetical protein
VSFKTRLEALYIWTTKKDSDTGRFGTDWLRRALLRRFVSDYVHDVTALLSLVKTRDAGKQSSW